MKFALLLAIAFIGCSPKKPVARTGVEIDVPIQCLTQPVRLLNCDPNTLKCQGPAIVQHRKDCEEIKVVQ